MALLKELEGLRLKAYKDSAGVWTIGYGHIHGVYPGMTCTAEDAFKWLVEDVWYIEEGVCDLVTTPLNQNEFDALVLFSFNVGLDIDADDKAEGLGDSTLLKKLNAGDKQGAAEEFGKWVNAGGKPVQGLVKRRKLEKELFLKAA